MKLLEFENKYNIALKNLKSFPFPDELIKQIVNKKKTCTTSSKILLDAFNAPIPKAREYITIRNIDNEIICVIKISKTKIIPFNKINREYALQDGFSSLKKWKEAHEKMFNTYFHKINKNFDNSTEVLCIYFSLIARD